MQFTKLSEQLGAEVTGIDLHKALSPEQARELRAALDTYQVLVFRDQNLDDRAQVEFSRAFGPLEIFPHAAINREDYPEVMEVADVADTSKYVSTALLWHSDGSFKSVPAYITMLRAEIAAPDGDTCFCDIAAGYDALPDVKKKQLDGLEVIHDLAHSRSLMPNIAPMSEEDKKRVPPVKHPLLRVHSGNGRKTLYLGNHAREIVGMDMAHGQALLRELTDWTTQERFVIRHQWRNGDLVMWDNRGTMHRAAPYDYTRHRRVLRRTEVSGTAA